MSQILFVKFNLYYGSDILKMNILHCFEELNKIISNNFQTYRNQYLPSLINLSFLEKNVVELCQVYEDFLLKISQIQASVIKYIDNWKLQQQKSIITGEIDISQLKIVYQCNTIIVKFYCCLLEDLSQVSIGLNKFSLS